MRYLPLTASDRKEMLKKIGVRSINELFETIPETVRLKQDLTLPKAQSEMQVERNLKRLASKNKSAGQTAFFIGGGAYRHHIPASVDHIIQRSEFLTAYTPYQPEISQGTLQSLFEFQTQICLLTGMEVANASMYDGSTACAEAALMATRITRRKKVILASGLHPHYLQVSRTMMESQGVECVYLHPEKTHKADQIDQIDQIVKHINEETACVIIQNPNAFGALVDVSDLAKTIHEKGALLIMVVTEIISLGAVKNPGEMGADIVVGEGQSLGVGLNFGGPYIGFFACKSHLVRQMPGRVVGETIDEQGRRGYTLTLSTREQHIRREKATSNICTNSGLCCLAFSIHLALLGEKGLKQMAMINHQKACEAAKILSSIEGVELRTNVFFNEFILRLPKMAHEIVELLAEQDVLAGIPCNRLWRDSGFEKDLLIAVTETNTTEDIQNLANALKKVL